MIGNTNLYTNLTRRSKILTRRIKAVVIKRNYSKTSNVLLEDDEKTTHFGFQTIKETDKTKEGEDFITFIKFVSYPISIKNKKKIDLFISLLKSL